MTWARWYFCLRPTAKDLVFTSVLALALALALALVLALVFALALALVLALAFALALALALALAHKIKLYWFVVKVVDIKTKFPSTLVKNPWMP
jgi:Na+(H+)/acetate symporter ActP